jgi:hypothetical protein
MMKTIQDEYDNAVAKRDEIKDDLNKLESETPHDHYNITITRDRLAYWEGKSEGLKFALDHLK